MLLRKRCLVTLLKALKKRSDSIRIKRIRKSILTSCRFDDLRPEYFRPDLLDKVEEICAVKSEFTALDTLLDLIGIILLKWLKIAHIKRLQQICGVRRQQEWHYLVAVAIADEFLGQITFMAIK